MIYKVLPDVKSAWSDVWLGGFVTAVLFTVGKYLIALYLKHGNVASPYGAAGSLVILLVFIYYSALILFFGAEFTAVYARQCGSLRGEQPLRTQAPTPRRAMGLAPDTEMGPAGPRPAHTGSRMMIGIAALALLRGVFKGR